MSLLLKPEQVESVEFGLTRKRWILGDDPGLGKSATSLTVDNQIVGKIKPRTLIVCPRRKCLEWRDEIGKWLGVGEVWVTIINRHTKNRPIEIAKHNRYTVITHAFFTKHIDDLCKVKWCNIIIDESHKTNNRKTKITKALTKISLKHKETCINFVTGTPLMNRAEDLFPALHIIDSTKYSSYWAWVDQNFETYTVRYGNFPTRKIGKLKDPEAFKAEMANYIIRHEANPDDKPVERLIPLEMEPRQLAMYKTMWKNMYSILEDGSEIAAQNVLSQYMKLRQISISADLLIPDSNSIEGPKAEALLEMLEDIDDRCLIFTNFRECARRLSLLLNSKGYKTSYAHGETINDNIVRDFPKCDHFIMSIGIAEGIDGLQHHSSNAVFIDKHWNPARNKQALCRLARFGQTKLVNCHSLLMDKTIEAKIAKTNQAKMELFDSVIPVTIADILKIVKSSSTGIFEND